MQYRLVIQILGRRVQIGEPFSAAKAALMRKELLANELPHDVEIERRSDWEPIKRAQTSAMKWAAGGAPDGGE